MKNNERPTRGIKHWGLSGYSNILQCRKHTKETKRKDARMQVRTAP